MATRLEWTARGEAGLPAGEGWLSAAEREYVAGLRFAKRRTEFLVARRTAKEAIARVCGITGGISRIEVRHHPSGAPEAFVDGRRLELGMSLTDRAGWAVCLLGLGPGEVGCDLELVEPRSRGFVRDYFTGPEQRFIAGSDLWANLLWSAKESALKVLRTGLRRDTRTVEVTVPGEPGPGWSPLTVRTAEGPVLPGWWIRYGRFLLTVATRRPTGPPVALDSPPALDTATPSHSWLGAPVLDRGDPAP